MALCRFSWMEGDRIFDRAEGKALGRTWAAVCCSLAETTFGLFVSVTFPQKTQPEGHKALHKSQQSRLMVSTA